MNDSIRFMESAPGATVTYNGRQYDYYCGTSYYGLHADPRVRDAACEAIRLYGIGTANGRSVYATTPPMLEVEERAAQFFETETSMHIISGYLSNMFLAQALRDDYDVAFYDSASHYSILDGLRATEKTMIPFKHLDSSDLRRQLHLHLRPGQVPLVMTDGIFPVTGVIAPLSDYEDILAVNDGALLCVDDAHAVGVIGKKGQGALEYHGLRGPNYYLCGTLSKAVGGYGGIIPGSQELMDKISRNVKVPIGASSAPSALAAASAMGLKILSEHPEMREQLWSNVATVRSGLRQLGFDIPDSPVPIVAVEGLPGMDLKRVRQTLRDEGIMVTYVPARGYSDVGDQELLRISVFSTHTREQMGRLLSGLSKLI